MNQLHLPIITLKNLGFRKKIDGGSVIYKIDCINSQIYFNPEEIDYVWYHQTILGDSSNFAHLDVRTIEDLNNLLRIFRVKTP